MKIPYKTEPATTLISLDHEQFISSRPGHVKDLIIGMHMHNDEDLIRAEDVIVRIRRDKKLIEDRFAGPVSKAHKAHKELTTERNEVLENYEWAENLLKEKMKMYHMNSDRKALAEAEVTTTSMTPPKLRPVLNHTTFVEKWKYKITDPAKLPPEYLIPNEKAIAATVNAMGAMAKIAGITVYRDDQVRIKT